MKQFYLLSTLLYALAISNPVSAQITIDEVKTDPSERILKNEVRPHDGRCTELFQPRPLPCRACRDPQGAQYPRIRRRHTRIGRLVQRFVDRNFGRRQLDRSGRHAFPASHLYQTALYHRNQVRCQVRLQPDEYRIAGDGGSTTSEGTWYKNQDEFQISTNPAYIINKSWLVGSIIKFRSQFANGYVSRSQQTADDRKSTFMSPGYLDISGGFTYTCPLERFRSRSTSRRSP